MLAKKMLRVTALAMALVFMFSAVALAAIPSVIYYQNEQGAMVKADYQQALELAAGGNPALLNALKTAFIDAQDKSRSILVKNDDGTVVNWQNALQAGKSYQDAVNAPEFAATEPEPGLELVLGENNQVVEKPIVTRATAVADVTLGALGFTDIKVKSTTVPGVAKFKVAGSTLVADLGSAIRILKGASQSTVEITLLASDGVTVKATGTLTFPAQTTTDITFEVTATGQEPPEAGTAVADVTLGALGFTDIKVKSTTVPGVAKFKVAGSTLVADLGSAIRILKGASQSTVEITLLASDGVTVKATGTLTFPAQTATDITFEVTATSQ